jgi:hypothetical protein
VSDYLIGRFDTEGASGVNTGKRKKKREKANYGRTVHKQPMPHV